NYDGVLIQDNTRSKFEKTLRRIVEVYYAFGGRVR
ncbi:unnamed protein product, partial [Brassicogethes aeneus]